MKHLLLFITLALLLPLSCSKSSENDVTVDQNKSDSTKRKNSSSYVITKTDFTGEEVVRNIKKGINERGLTIFSEMPHHEAAQKIEQELSFTHVIIFGNPKIGTKLMRCDQKIGLELPLKILVYTNKKGKTFISYTNLQFYHKNYRLRECKQVLNNIEKMLRQLAHEAAKKQP